MPLAVELADVMPVLKRQLDHYVSYEDSVQVMVLKDLQVTHSPTFEGLVMCFGRYLYLPHPGIVWWSCVKVVVRRSL